MAIAFRSASAKASGTGAVTPALPASMVAGDIVILVATTIAGGSMTITTAGSISTWTEITSGGIDVASGEKMWVWWGRFSSGSTGPTVTPGSDHACAGTVAYSGCVPNGSPIDVSTTSTEVTSDTSFSFATGLTTGENNTLCVCAASQGNDSNTATYGNMANSSLISLNNRQDFCTNSGGGGGYSLQDGVKATAGTMGTFSSTLSASSPKAYVAFSLRPDTSVTVSCGLGAPTLSGLASTVSVTSNTQVLPGVGAPTLAGLAPKLDSAINIGVAASTISGLAPVLNSAINSGLGALTVSGFAPTVSVSDNKNVSSGKADATITGLVPVLNSQLNLNLGALQITGFAPAASVSDNQNISTDKGDLTINGLVPGLDFAFISNLGVLSLTGFSPTVDIASGGFNPATGLLTLDGFAPLVDISNNTFADTLTGQLLLAGFEPDISVARHVGIIKMRKAYQRTPNKKFNKWK